jgi:hypothetical protein
MVKVADIEPESSNVQQDFRPPCQWKRSLEEVWLVSTAISAYLLDVRYNVSRKVILTAQQERHPPYLQPQ